MAIQVVNDKTLFEDKIREFLLEDLGMGDITTDSLVDESMVAEGEIVCKEDGVIAGLNEASEIFETLGCTVKPLEKDGDSVTSEKGPSSWVEETLTGFTLMTAS